MGTFTDLKTIGTKVIKFKQSKVLNTEEAIWAVDLDNGRFAKVQEGVCAALTMAYVKDVIGKADSTILGPLIEVLPSHLTRFKRDAGVSSANKANRDIAANAIKYQEKFSDQWKADPSGAVTSMAFAEGLKVGDQNALGPDFLKNWHMTILADPLRTLGYVIYTFVFVGSSPQKTGAHAVAVGKVGSRVHFFDPNVGGYIVDFSRWNEFNAKYLEILKSGIKWDYSAGVIVYLRGLFA